MLLSNHKNQKFQMELFHIKTTTKLLQKSEMRKDIVIELSYKGFG